ncbi:MAG: hypothetical protein QOK36_4239 [Gaiellales bacterium]|jgi:hypothetical protein|nr:hypothetical protein [Gaiellales bacterium]
MPEAAHFWANGATDLLERSFVTLDDAHFPSRLERTAQQVKASARSVVIERRLTPPSRPPRKGRCEEENGVCT